MFGIERSDNGLHLFISNRSFHLLLPTILIFIDPLKLQFRLYVKPCLRLFHVFLPPGSQPLHARHLRFGNNHSNLMRLNIRT